MTIDHVKQGKKKVTKKELAKIEKRKTNKKFKQWSIDVRNRDGNRCSICNKTEYIHAHHIIPRENKETRFDIDNGIALCAKHHKFNIEISAHKNPMSFLIWFKKNRPKQWRKLYSYY